MNTKKIAQNPSLAYTSNPSYRNPPKTPNPVSVISVFFFSRILLQYEPQTFYKSQENSMGFYLNYAFLTFRTYNA